MAHFIIRMKPGSVNPGTSGDVDAAHPGTLEQISGKELLGPQVGKVGSSLDDMRKRGENRGFNHRGYPHSPHATVAGRRNSTRGVFKDHTPTSLDPEPLCGQEK